jgi:polar amino acid transport system substrate-binding protein
MRTRRTRVLSLVLALVLVSLAAGVCGAQEVDRLDRILKRGKITIGIICDFPPVGFYNEKGELVGYDVDLAKDLARTLGVKIEWVPVNNETRSAVLVSDKVDVVFSNYTRTPERAKVIDFSDPYVVTGLTILTRKEYGVKNLADIIAKKIKIGVGKGTIGDLLLAQRYPNADKMVFDSMQDCLVALKQKKVGAVLEDMTWVQAQAKSDPNLVALGELLTMDVNCVALRRGQPGWKDWINIWLDDLNRSGRNREYFIKWFGYEPLKLTPSY